MNFELRPEEQEFQATVRAFADREVAPVADALDHEHRFPTEIVKKAGPAGLMGVAIKKEFGGRELGNAGSAILVEEMSRVCASTGVTLSVHNSLVATPISRFGSDGLKRMYLPRLASGEMLGAYALTEPNAGSDAANQTTKAEKKGDRYVLTGTKLWITSGQQADLFIVFARTSLDDPTKKHKGITAFVVERAWKGITPGKSEEKCGIRGSSTTELVLDGCEVPESNVLGTVGDGFTVAMDTLDGGRIGIGGQAVGIAQACLDVALDYARNRRQFGKPIGTFQAVQWKLAEMATNIEAARLLVRKAAWQRDRGDNCSLAASMAKLMASTMANRAADDAVSILGGAGYTRDFPVERFFRDARITEIYEGTTEVQHLVIAKHVLGNLNSEIPIPPMSSAALNTADHDLLARALTREKRSLGRLLSRAERDGDEFAALHSSLFSRIGRALRIGITGPPGAGKSTLVERYALSRRELGDKVAVVAVDPSSPFTGGALLGDRVRMNRIALDPDCFVRSMASRGAFGGLARTTDEVADCFDAAGYERIVLETVGVGQSEVEVAKSADVTIVVLVPGAGDSVQAMKAGLMEIADVFVVNKADRPGVERVLAELEEVLELRADGKKPAIVQTVASNGEGIERLNEAIEAFVAASKSAGDFERRRREHLAVKVHRIVEETLRERLFEGKGLVRRVDEALAEDPPRPPYAIASELLREVGIGLPGDSGAPKSGRQPDR